MESADWKLPSIRKVGIVSLIVTESSLFTIFVVAYIYYIGKSLNPPYPAQVLDFPLLATVCLLSSSFTVLIAEKAIKKGNGGVFRLWWLVTIVLGLVFLGYTAHEWWRLIFHDKLTISTNVFGSTFYSLVGLHASHVIVGLIMLSVVFFLHLGGHVREAHHEHVEMISWYWHFVDVVWVVVVTVVYIISVRAPIPS